MTELQNARKGNITKAMRTVAENEGLPLQKVVEGVGNGTIVIPLNKQKKITPVGIGLGLSTKVNANIGTSKTCEDISIELQKLVKAIEAGADTVMDLSTGRNIEASRRKILEKSSVPVGSVPIYQAGLKNQVNGKPIVQMDKEDMFQVIQEQAKDGIDFMTIHSGLTRGSVEHLIKVGRTSHVVSRGGSFLLAWMLHNDKENPLYEDYERLIKIALEYDVTLSLGDALRPGCIADASDRAQIQELIILGELVEEAREAGVQVMVEGPGHMPLDQIEANVILQKKICKGAPFYVLGPIVTDIAAGYDHITSAIGGAVAAASGADFLCYVTPSEHLSLPDLDAVKEGVIAAKIAAHSGDIVKQVPGAWARDKEMSVARKELNWKKQRDLALDPGKFGDEKLEDGKGCSMCEDYCAMKIVKEYMKG